MIAQANMHHDVYLLIPSEVLDEQMHRQNKGGSKFSFGLFCNPKIVRKKYQI